MRWITSLRLLVLCSSMFVTANALAQSADFDPGPLPISPTSEQIVSLIYIAPGPLVEAGPRSANRRRPARVQEPLTTEQIAYRESVRALGTDDHQFVRVELNNGKVRTGAIISMDDSGFQLRVGIFDTNYVTYSQLKNQPRHVPAVGTHIANGFKWVGMGVGVALLIPFLPFVWFAGVQC
jgi:hypothetical protein